MKLLSLLLLSAIFLFSNELILDDMLKEYEDSESLYKQTKKESAGFLLIYSREDLERMQAFNLRDVLKTIRMYSMQVHNAGAIRVQKSGAGKSSMPPIKLYIDNYEVSTIIQSNSLDMYGEMDIYFVDHIEVYQGGSSIAFGNEPGSMVIRLYSKDPSKENSRSAQLSIDSKSGGNLRAVDAGMMGKYKYLLYANAAKEKYDKHERNNQELSRDAKSYQAHFMFSQEDNFEVVVDGITKKADIFNGFGSAPLGDYSDLSYGYLSATKYFENNFKISTSASLERKEVFNSDAVGLQLATDAPGVPTGNNFHAKLDSNTYKAIVEKKFINGKSDLLIGAQFQHNEFKINAYEGTNITPNIGPNELDIYMFYLEELYNINENHLLSFSAKLDHYKNSFSKESTEYAIRLGYNAILGNNFSTKLFAIRRFIYPNMLQTSFSHPGYKPNPDLGSSKVNMLSGELEYNDKKSRAVFGYAYKVIDDAHAFSPVAKMYINKEDTIYFNRIYLRGEHKFDFDNKIIVEYFKGHKDVYATPGAGVLVQLFNKFDKFDIYNELVFREGYTFNFGAGDVAVDEGYNYTLAVSYPLNREINIKAKGENLLDKATKTVIDPQGLVQIPAIEKRAILTMEYTF